MWPDLETPFIKLPEKYKPPLIIFLGFMTSLWSCCIFITSVAQYGFMGGAKQIIISTGILSFITISFCVSFGLHWSFKQHDPFYILPWLYTKIIEVILMFIAIILLAVYDWYAWLIFPAVVYIIFGVYIIYCIYKTYKKVNHLWQPVNDTTDSIGLNYNKECLPIITTPYIACNEKMKTPFLIIIGLLVSFWANCVFNAGLSREVYIFYLDKLIAGFGIATYHILSLGTTIGLFYGLKNNDPDYMKFWFFNKVLDELGLLVGIILVIVDGAYCWGLIPVGIFIMVIGFYVVYCMRKQYNKMRVAAIQPQNQNNTTTSTVNTTSNTTDTGPPKYEYIEEPPHYEQIIPPSYDQFVNQSQVNHI